MVCCINKLLVEIPVSSFMIMDVTTPVVDPTNLVEL